MPAESLFSMPVLLWVIGSIIAFFLLIGSMTRRRLSLTQLLRQYVDRHQSKFKDMPAPPKPNPPASPPQSPPDS